MRRRIPDPSLLSKNRERLHITEGESTAGSLYHALERVENVLPWYDGLYFGPVPDSVDFSKLARLRERYWAPDERLRAGEYVFIRRNRILARFREFKEIVLWFGPGSLGQLDLLQVLSWLSEQDRSNVEISLVSGRSEIMPKERLLQALASRKRVKAAQYRLARSAWVAYRSPTPAKMNKLLASNLSALPDLQPVVLTMLQCYPSTSNGLSWLERCLLEGIRDPGEIRVANLICDLMWEGGELNERQWGDGTATDVLRQLIRDRNQAIRFAKPFSGDLDNYEFNSSVLRLTDFGHQLLAGEADYVAYNGIDRWIGGVHLQGFSVPWRWDADSGSVVASKAG